MPTPCPAAHSHRRRPAKPRPPCPRRWTTLPVPMQRQLAQQLARVLQRVLEEETHRADDYSE